ncbi:TetR family transcriptional regulator [Arthrobacter crystallopoietes BAB-32]|uniref:TetR family transcriptional regulator n=1 Tax=Arthrobacter crystallopoietes BAB-32 TaxID=1246476 RepID=N1UYT6_9MICC|nr:TetR/AcrR family transcriptional regulator [Arthrobacter crystallopoietes]EMY32997.1 TetR family transcriptional regulator [Arthrobacter crystallopoietes BAB-32]
MSKSATGRAKLSRGSLTARSIAEATLRLLDEHGLAAFTLPRLGRALGADQTAVYRHYADKDEIVLAVADLLLDEVMAGFASSGCWRTDIADLSRRIRDVYKRHPAAGSLSGSRTTGRDGEKRLVEAFLSAILTAGFEGHDAALYYRVVADFSLFWAGGHAAYLSLDPQRQFADESSWVREYSTVNPGIYPHTAEVRRNLAEVGFDEIFETALTLMLDGIAARAPAPCSCAPGSHASSQPKAGPMHGRRS